MTISRSVETYLDQAHIHYDLISHKTTESALESARLSHIPISNMAKAVMLKDYTDDSFLLAILPASNRLMMPWIYDEINRNLVLADESELETLFPDCALGAVPGFGQAYNLDIIWDDQLQQQPDVYFEAGDHRELIHINKQQFASLFQDQAHSVISLPAESLPRYDEIHAGFN